MVAGFAILTEVLFTADTVYAGITSATDIRISTVGTFFVTVRAYCCTIRATVTTITDGFNTFTAVIAFVTPSA